MNIFGLKGLSAGRRGGTSPRRRDRGFRAEVERCEARLVLSATSIIQSGTLLSAVAPGLAVTSQTLNNGVLTETVTNTNKTTAFTVGAAVYQDQQDTTPVVLSQQVLLAVKYYEVDPGQTITFSVGGLCCDQLDVFVNKVGSTTVTNVVTQFSPYITPTFGAGPEVDAGYNTQNYQPSSPSSTTPAGLVGTLIAYDQTAGDCASGASPLTQGYWKNHTSDWPALPTFTVNGVSVTGLTLGDQFYTASQLETIFQTPVTGNAAINLAHQEIAAKLNMLAGSTVSTSLLATLANADTLLTGINVLTTYVPSSSPLGTAMVNDSNILEAFNSSGH